MLSLHAVPLCTAFQSSKQARKALLDYYQTHLIENILNRKFLIFVDIAIVFIQVYPQVALTAGKTLHSKPKFRRLMKDYCNRIFVFMPFPAQSIQVDFQSNGESINF